VYRLRAELSFMKKKGRFSSNSSGGTRDGKKSSSSLSSASSSARRNKIKQQSKKENACTQVDTTQSILSYMNNVGMAVMTDAGEESDSDFSDKDRSFELNPI
jgi:hypothetical protein